MDTWFNNLGMNAKKRARSKQYNLLLFFFLFLIGVFYISLFSYLYAESKNFLTRRQMQESVEWAESRSISIPLSLSFRTDSPWTHALSRGWNAPEQWGVWSRSSTAQIVLPRLAGGKSKAICFTFDIGAIVSSDQEQWPIRILIDNRHFVTKEYYKGAGPHEIQGMSIVDHGPITITFTGPTPRSPFSINGSRDRRLLSISLFKVQLSKSCALHN